MKNDFLNQLQQNGVCQGDHILLAVSGGVDSMVLMDLLYKTKYQFSIAHCNFCLRGADSDADQAFVESMSQYIQIPIFIKKFDTKKYAKQHKISIQMAARDLRYSWFKELMTTHAFNFLATAHHLNDSVETMLINLIRGTGIAGLHGIEDGLNNLIRPLLSLKKGDIINYAQKNNIEYREDVSNIDNKYIRNKIRNQIIPLMQEINPNVIDSVGDTISKLRAVEGIYNNVLSEKKSKLLIRREHEYVINIKNLLKELSPKQLLYEIISDFGFYDVDRVFRSLYSESGREFFNSDFYMIKDRFELIISEHIVNEHCIVYEHTKSAEIPFKINFKTSLSPIGIDFSNNMQIHIDYSKLVFPLLIRPWEKGDRFIPLGMRNFKKISDYFIDHKFSLIKKKKTRLLISNNQIVCIIGERLDDRFKLVETSKKVYIVGL
tara:strand:+ start:9922 stop:11223 length:1302 start_codon:yes stop_codon:yes gene_type:complete